MIKKNLKGILTAGLIGTVLSFNNSFGDDQLVITFKSLVGGISAGITRLQHTNTSDNAYLEPPLPTFVSYSLKSGNQLSYDSRLTSDDSTYRVILSGHSNSGPITSTPFLRFSWAIGPESNRIYAARVHLDKTFTSNGEGQDFAFLIPSGRVTTNFLPSVIFDAPDTNANSATLSYIDISPAFAAAKITKFNVLGGTNGTIEALVQPGTTNTLVSRDSMTTGTWNNVVGQPAQNSPLTTNTFGIPQTITYSNIDTSGSSGYLNIRTSN